MRPFQKPYKFLLSAAMLCVCFSMISCAVKQQEKEDIILRDNSAQTQLVLDNETEQITAVICDYINEASCQTTMDELEILQNLVHRLGEYGYTAIDGENQIDMTNAAQVIGFCEAVDAKKTAELTILQIFGSREMQTAAADINSNAEQENGIQGFQKYDFHTKDGAVDVDRSFYQYITDKKFSVRDTVKYRADLWQYTQEGYLLFAGSYFSEDYYIVSLAEAPEHAAVRVAPLDRTCRELNRRYVLPVGYACNNLFLSEWDETDFGSLDMYDLFDRFYPMVCHQPVPYVLNENPNKGVVYGIPEKEFETVVQSFLNISSSTLQSQTLYVPADKTYSYRPRGLYEIECTSQPYPEVVGYTENADGTITLTVNAVFPYENTAKAFSHEVTIRLAEDGAFQYVSNRIVGEVYDAWWRTERLTSGEWEEIYGEQTPKTRMGQEEPDGDETLWYLPHADECLLNESEKKELEDIILTAAESVRQQYENMEIVQGTSYASGVKNFSKETCREVVRLLGNAGYVSVADDVNMENYEEVETFYQAYVKAHDAEVTIFQVHSDGLLGVVTFLCRKGSLQAYYVGVDWKEGGTPYIKNTLVSNVSEMKMTPKGYLIYTYEETVVHADANEYLRVKPLSEECRELTKKYVYGISFANYDAFVTSWDSSTAEEILEPCLFEDIYRMYTGENIKLENDRIPAEEYEHIMMIYFPVTKQQLRRKCGYDAASDSYPYERIFASPYAPFGEVVGYTQNADGTITLTVDGVRTDFGEDCVFTDRIVVQPFADGTFRYLSNEYSDNGVQDLPQ